MGDPTTMGDPNHCAPDDLKKDGTQDDHHDPMKDAKRDENLDDHHGMPEADLQKMADPNRCAPDDLPMGAWLGGNLDDRHD